MNRREFTGRASTAFLFLLTQGTALLVWGCNLFTDILNWVPTGEAALNSIITILTGNGVIINPAIQMAINLIEAGFTALTAAVKEYQSTTPPPIGALNKIEAAFHAIVDNFSTFLASLNVSGGLLSIIVGLANVVLSTIAAFTNQLPASMGLKAVRDKIALVRVGGQLLNVQAKPRSNRQFRNDFNAVLKTATPDVKVPANAYLK